MRSAQVVAFLRLLKAGHYLPPLAALVLAVGWQLRQRQAVADMEREIEEARQQVAILKQTGEGPEAQTRTREMIEQATLKKIHATDPAKLDWKRFAMMFDDKFEPGGPNEVDGNRLMTQFVLWTPGQLTTALDQIDKSPDLSAQEKSRLLTQLESALAARFPEAALKRLDARLEVLEGFQAVSLNYPIQKALESMARKDPTAAAAWLDREIADGKIKEDGHPSRQYIEAGMLGGMLENDPAAAFERLAAYPGDKKSLLSYIRPSAASAP
ncbi:MAG: hypothetical protein JWO82_277, partial [Akkermansiaceae bacterium]|nr:hypothetical protein [Akkermansiaceae bacterium]